MLPMGTAQLSTIPTSAHPRTLLSANVVKNILLPNTDRYPPDITPFHRWRPKYHLIAAYGWMNDPCAPAYDPISKTYHVAFQWNDNGNDWGIISWGSALSKDLVSWEISQETSLSPSAPYDSLGVFTGYMIPTSISGVSDGTLTCFYTSVSKLPISYRIKYEYGSESLSVATSKDTGRTWQRHASNPILPGPPVGVQVTGWRDPFVATWPSLSTFLGTSPGGLFGIISGGIVGKTPTAFLYAVATQNLTEWTYLGPLINTGLNKFTSRWSGDLGVNWEVVNFATIVDDSGAYSMETLIVSVEGTLPEHRPRSVYPAPQNKPREIGFQLWVCGSFQTGSADGTGGGVSLRHEFGGILDHGCYYAGNSFWDPIIKQTIIMGWTPDGDLPHQLRHKQGWSGSLTLPRVLGVQTLRRVSHARVTPLEELTSFSKEVDENSTFTLRTLRIRPHPALEKLRREMRQPHVLDWPSLMSGKARVQLESTQWELHCQMALSEGCTRAGVRIGYPSIGSSKYVDIYYDIPTSSIIIDRSAIHTCETKICNAPEIAPFTLFTCWEATQNRAMEEELDIKIFCDSSVLEVFFNERVAITTRVYYDAAAGISGRSELGFLSDSDNRENGLGIATITACKIWDRLDTK